MRRTATVGSLAAREAVKQFGTRAANLTRDEQSAREASARRQLETAKQIVAVLGTMKGAAMKLGQVMSFLDVGLVPEEYREEFQRKLAELRDSAPKVSFGEMRRVIESEYEDPIEALSPPGELRAVGYRYLTVQVANIDELVAECARAGCPVPMPVTQAAPGVQFAFVDDPDGNRVELVQVGPA